MFSILRDNASSSSSIQQQSDQLVHNLAKAYDASINPQLLWQQRLKKMLAYARRQLELEQKKRFIRERVQMTMEASTQNDLCLGDQRLRKIRWQLNNFGVIRSADQVMFHEAFIRAWYDSIDTILVNFEPFPFLLCFLSVASLRYMERIGKITAFVCYQR